MCMDSADEKSVEDVPVMGENCLYRFEFRRKTKRVVGRCRVGLCWLQTMVVCLVGYFFSYTYLYIVHEQGGSIEWAQVHREGSKDIIADP